MNPFINQDGVRARGDKIAFYYSQFSEIGIGKENARKIELCEGDENQIARMYLSKFKSGSKMKFKTIVCDGFLWVCRLC
jgi:hypothetical protein